MLNFLTLCCWTNYEEYFLCERRHNHIFLFLPTGLLRSHIWNDGQLSNFHPGPQMEWKRIQMESSAGAPQSDGSTSLYLHKYEYTYNTNTDQNTKFLVELLTLHYISKDPQQSSDRSVFSLGEPRHTTTSTKRAKRMTDWANVRMIKDGPVLMENENTHHNQNHNRNIFSQVFRHSCTVSFLWDKRSLYLGQILVSTSIWWYLGIYLSPIRMEAVWRLHRSYPDEIFVCK